MDTGASVLEVREVRAPVGLRMLEVVGPAGLLGLSCLALLELTICYTTEKAGLGSEKAGLGSGKAASHSVTGLCMIKRQLRLAHPGALSEGQRWRRVSV